MVLPPELEPQLLAAARELGANDREIKAIQRMHAACRSAGKAGCFFAADLHVERTEDVVMVNFHACTDPDCELAPFKESRLSDSANTVRC